MSMCGGDQRTGWDTWCCTSSSCDCPPRCCSLGFRRAVGAASAGSEPHALCITISMFSRRFCILEPAASRSKIASSAVRGDISGLYTRSWASYRERWSSKSGGKGSFPLLRGVPVGACSLASCQALIVRPSWGTEGGRVLALLQGVLALGESSARERVLYDVNGVECAALPGLDTSWSTVGDRRRKLPKSESERVELGLLTGVSTGSCSCACCVDGRLLVQLTRSSCSLSLSLSISPSSSCACACRSLTFGSSTPRGVQRALSPSPLFRVCVRVYECVCAECRAV